MNKKPDDTFFRLVRNFLTIYLPKSRCYSPNTVKAYRDTINLFREFLATGNHDLDKELESALSGAGIATAGPVYYREALKLGTVLDGVGAVVISPALSGSIAVNKAIFSLRKNDMRVILLAGDASDELREAAIGMGVWDIIDDPVNAENVVESVLHPATFASVVGSKPHNASAVSKGMLITGSIGNKRVAEDELKEEQGNEQLDKEEAESDTSESPIDFAGMDVWANFSLPGVNAFDCLPDSRADVVLIKAGPGAEDLVKRLRREKSFLAVPIIIVGASDRAYLDAGADDRVLELTPQTIQSILRVKKRIKDLWTESETDALTGCYTRKFLDSYMRSLDQRPYSLFMCDLDYFKQVNDTYGHDAGDAVLKAFGRHLRENLRETDVCVRYGGEEFLAVLPGVTPEDAEKVALKICLSWQGQSIETDADVISCTVSIGVSGSSPESIKNADAALYEAKKAGRNRVVRGQAARDSVMPEPVRQNIYSDKILPSKQEESPPMPPKTGIFSRGRGAEPEIRCIPHQLVAVWSPDMGRVVEQVSAGRMIVTKTIVRGITKSASEIMTLEELAAA